MGTGPGHVECGLVTSQIGLPEGSGYSNVQCHAPEFRLITQSMCFVLYPHCL